MCLTGRCDNKREDNHTDRQLTAQYHAPRTRPHVATESPLHRRCVAILPLRRRRRSGEEYRPNSARCLLIRRDGKGPHRACKEVVLRVVEKWVP